MAEKELDIIMQAVARNTDAINQTTQRIQGLDGAAKSVSSSTKIADEALGNLTVTTTKHGDALNTTIARTSAVASEERDLTRDGREAAKAMGEMGAKGGELFERFSALAGVMGSGGGFGVAVGAALVSVGALVEGAHKLNETYEEQLSAAGSLKQATQATGVSYDEATSAIEEYATANEGLISNVNEAKVAEAGFIRAGFDVKDAMTDVQIAVNLAALKHEDLATAGHQVLLMLEGNGRVAKELGIDIKALANSVDTADTAYKDLEKSTKAVSTAQTEVDTRTRVLRDATEQLKLKEDELAAKHKTTAADADQLATAHQRVNDATTNLKAAQDKLAGAEFDAKTAQDNLADSHSKATSVQNELNQKTANGTGALTDQQVAANQLGQEWDKLAHDSGPALNAVWTEMIGLAAGFVSDVDDAANAVGWLISQLNSLASVGPGAMAAAQGAGPPGAVGSGGRPPPGLRDPGTGSVGRPPGLRDPGVGMTNIFNISGGDPAAIAAAVDARLAWLLSST